ncbi:MAG: hypothetical protein M1820_010708 [Bogoriella megaspora]|nr:MAG: hypothetical protein M1820_010708 [Bogoriella megaspora]
MVSGNTNLTRYNRDNGTALGEIFYEDADTSIAPSSSPWPFTDVGRCNNDDLSITNPYFPIPLSEDPPFTQVVSINRTVNETGHQEWQINDIAFRGNYNHPLLGLAHVGNFSYPDDPEWNVYNFGSNASVRLVVNNESPDDTLLSHPMHLHGHDFFVVAEGEGRWDGSTIIRRENPQRRDTQMVRRAGFAVLDIVLDNSGVWPFHCHIAWHVSEGLYINILERPSDIRKRGEVPAALKETCESWNAYTRDNIVEQLDSGLRMERMGRMRKYA